MRKKEKVQAIELVKQLSQAHDEIKNSLEHNNNSMAVARLTKCQEKAIELGNFIEKFDGEGCTTVSLIEKYCELVYNIHEEISAKSHINENKIYKNLRRQLIQIENSINNDITLKKEVVFLPYKASMWDSLESIYLAAREDENCDAYVIPIPYYDRNPDGSMGKAHYEGDMYPSNIPITRYDTYDFGLHRPDMIFIHNPYDDCNLVTSVHPFFYSDKMKKCTDCLVYVPYYATSGGQAESQSLCPAYINADYIVIQSEQYRKYYDSRIPDSKFLAFGSPKFDSIIKKCQNPPEKPEELKDKKVYFYNTSIGGMLYDTESFLDKMEYVFDTFKEHPEACLLWRPHPLLESTFDSMRPMYKARYEALKQRYIDEKIGIYDTTPSIEQSVAMSDVYIGDSGSSVTSLFGVVGKPVFILNNSIHDKPEEDDWKGEYNYLFFSPDMDNRWIVRKGDKLWHSENNDFNYKYYCDLIDTSRGLHYMFAKQKGNKIYIMPNFAQDIIIVENKKIRKIKLKQEPIQDRAFNYPLYTEKYAFLIPMNYPYVIRFDFETEEIVYIDGLSNFIVRMINGKILQGIASIVDNKLYMSSPIESEVRIIDIDTLEVKETRIPLTRDMSEDTGIVALIPRGGDMWVLPAYGTVIRRWNPRTNETRSYSNIPKEFKSTEGQYPFGNMVFSKNRAFISPRLGNMYLCLDINTGRIEQWNPPDIVSQEMKGKNQYYITTTMGGFLNQITEDNNCLIWSAATRSLATINLETEEAREIEIQFDKKDVYQFEQGFDKISYSMVYGCRENIFNSLDNLINGKIIGNQHDKGKQIEAYKAINASPNGDCGEKVYRYLDSLL